MRRIDYKKVERSGAAAESDVLKNIHPAVAEPPVD
jgi:hypothetical protein